MQCKPIQRSARVTHGDIPTHRGGGGCGGTHKIGAGSSDTSLTWTFWAAAKISCCRAARIDRGASMAPGVTDLDRDLKKDNKKLLNK